MGETEVIPAVIQTTTVHRYSFHYTFPCYVRALWDLSHPPFLAPEHPVGCGRGEREDVGWQLGLAATGEFPGEESWVMILPSQLSSLAAGLEPSQASGPATSPGFPGLCMGRGWETLSQGFWRNKSRR